MELIKTLYAKANLKCTKGEAWEFETHFAQAIADYCAGVCEELATKVAGCKPGDLTAFGGDCANLIRKDFDVQSSNS